MTRRFYVDGAAGDLAVQHRRYVGAGNAPQMNDGSETGTCVHAITGASEPVPLLLLMSLVGNLT